MCPLLDLKEWWKLERLLWLQLYYQGEKRDRDCVSISS